MGGLSRHFNPGMTRDVAKTVAERMGKYLGSGISTVAYRVMVQEELPEIGIAPIDFNAPMHPMVNRAEPRVIRVSKNEAGIRATFEVAMANQDDPWAPKVYDMMDIRDGFIVEMEPLRKLGGFHSLVEEGLFKYVVEPGRWAGSTGKIVPTATIMRVSTFVHDIMRKQQSSWGLSFDLHGDNIMQRADGHPVMLDPLYGGGRYQGPKPVREVQQPGFGQRFQDVAQLGGFGDLAAIGGRAPLDKFRWELDNLNNRLVLQVNTEPKIEVAKSVPEATGIYKALKLKRRAVHKRNLHLEQLGGNQPAKLGKLK